MSITWLNEERGRQGHVGGAPPAVDLFRAWDRLNAAMTRRDWKAVEEISPAITAAVKTHGYARHCPYAVGTMYYDRAPEGARRALDAYNAAVRTARGRTTRPKVG